MLQETPKPRKLLNFTLEDVSVGYDLRGDNPEYYTLKSGEIQEFPDHIASLLEDKLAHRELWKNPPPNKNMEKGYNELLKRIRV